MVRHAAALADVGHQWVNQGKTQAEEMSRATAELERLRLAVDRYLDEFQQGDPP